MSEGLISFTAVFHFHWTSDLRGVLGRPSTVLDWIVQGLTFHSTRHILGHFADGGVTAASARIVAAVRAHSVCGVE